MKYFRFVHPVVAAVIGLLLVLSGCGTASINVYTKVKPSGDSTERLTIAGTGMMGTLLVSEQMTQELTRQGWAVTTNLSGDSTTLIASKDFARGQALFFPDTTNDTVSNTPVPVFIRKDSLFVNEYYYQLDVKGVPEAGNITNDQFAALGASMAQSWLNVSWTLELPGEIVETNADEHTGSAATWHFDLQSLAKDKSMMVRTREVKRPLIYGAGGAVVLAVSGVVALLFVKRRKPAEPPPAAPDKPADAA